MLNTDATITSRDAPIGTRAEDDYDRWPIATSISNVIAASTLDWSTRIGVYGRWGDGKTTVMKFLEGQQRRAGNIVVQYSPWGAKQEFAVWEDFARILKKALNEAGIHALDKKTVAKIHGRRLGKLFSVLGGAAAKVADERIGAPIASPLFEATSTLLGGLLDLDEKDIAEMVRQVGNRRIVVVIDDLDRTDPKVIPSLLLALRELLDLPRFVFVLAFDQAIVARSLASYNVAWGKSGESFLEKVIDFPFELPRPSQAQVRRLALRQFGALHEFFPIAAIDEVIDLLPENPRRLKLLARLIGALGPEAKRHSAEELDWFSILVFHMLRMESEEFTRRFVRQILEDKENSWLVATIAQNRERDQATEETNAILNEVFPPSDNDPRKERITFLVTSWRTKRGWQVGERLLYQVSFATSPHNITWGEFIPVFGKWRQHKSIKVFEDFVHAQAAMHEVAAEPVVTELVQTIHLHYGAVLERASNVVTQDSHRDLMDEANAALGLLRLVIFDGMAGVSSAAILTPEFLLKMMQTSMSWIHFRANPGEPELRGEEEKLLLDGCTKLTESIALFEKLSPWSEGGAGFDDRVDRLRWRLREKMTEVLWPAVIEECLTLFGRPFGVAGIRGDKGNDGIAFAIASPESKLYSQENEQRLVALLQRARDEPVIHNNAIDYLGLLLAALDHRGRFCGQNERVQFLAARQSLVISLWAAVLARPSQYRMLQSLRGNREKLVANGIPDNQLVTPDWLNAVYQDESVVRAGN